MADVKRFEVDPGSHSAHVYESPNGEYVRFTDYQKLLKEYEKLHTRLHDNDM